MQKIPALGLMAALAMGLAGCTGGGGGAASPPATTVTATATATAEAKVYSEDELRSLISGLTDDEGNEFKLYSKEQVEQGGNLADLLMSAATVEPADCKDIATAGLLDTVDNGQVAVAITESSQPRTLSVQSGREGPDAVEVLQEIRGKMGQCASFSVVALGQTYQVSSEELQADTDARETFATVSTRSEGQGKLMQVSAAQGRLLVVATKSGTDLGDQDQRELEDLINEVLQKAERSSSSPTSTTATGSTGTADPTGTASPERTASPAATATDNNQTSSPSPTTSR